MYCIRTLLRGEKPSLTKGEQLWDYLYSVDGARALYLIARKGRHGATYTLASGRSRPLREFFEHTRDCIDASLPLGLGEKEYPRGQILNFSANIAALTNDTGFEPQYSFDEGIRETIAWVRKDLAEHTVSSQVGDSDSLPAGGTLCTTAGSAGSRASATTC
jgi:nucleoside-diphosphate-sugar epimerase